MLKIINKGNEGIYMHTRMHNVKEEEEKNLHYGYATCGTTAIWWDSFEISSFTQ